MKQLLISIFCTMGLVRSKSKIILFLILSFFFIQCKAQEYSIEQVKSLMPTHQIKNNLVYEILNEINNKKDVFKIKDNIIILDIDKKMGGNYNISATCVSFLQSKILNRNKKLKGYFEYKNRIVLLYGNIDNFLFNKEKNHLENIMKFNYVVDKNHPPYVIEPFFIKYNIKNNLLSKKYPEVLDMQ